MGGTEDRKRNEEAIQAALAARQELRTQRLNDAENDDESEKLTDKDTYDPGLAELFSKVTISALGRVPPPFASTSPFSQQSHDRGTPALVKRSLKNAEKNAQYWLNFTKDYATIQAPLTLKNLNKRPDSINNRKNAGLRCKELELLGAYPYSARFIDRDTKTLCAVFAARPFISDEVVYPEMIGMKFQSEDQKLKFRQKLVADEYTEILSKRFKTAAEFNVFKEKLLEERGIEMKWDGLPELLTSYWENVTQALTSIVEPHPPKADIRHRYSTNNTSRYKSYIGDRDLHTIFESNYLPPAIVDAKGPSAILRTRMAMSDYDQDAAVIYEAKRKRSDSTHDVIEESESEWMDSLGPFFKINQERLQAGIYEERDPMSDDEGEDEVEEFVEMEDHEKFQKPYDHVEQAGIIHLAHCWQAQGQTGEFGMIQPSGDMLGGAAYKAVAVRTYIQATSYVHGVLSLIVKAAFPEEYVQRKKEFEAGRWIKCEDTTQLFLCEAIVWKLQVNLHRDVRDSGVCVVVPTGQFEGGRMVLPDLQSVLMHSRGSVLVFQSNQLYHAVETWKTVGDINPLGLTPGRISHTLFNTKFVAEKLQDKKADWFVNTAGGMRADTSQFAKRKRQDS